MKAAPVPSRARTLRSARTPLACGIGLGLALVAASGLARGGPGGEAHKALRRIFTLDTGATVRTVARQVDGIWEHQRGGTWQPAPWSIESMRLEREVLSEMRRLASRLSDDAPAAQRCEFADWMLRNGLVDEALAELDELVVAFPSGSGIGTAEDMRSCASHTLERHAFRFALPELRPDARDAASALEPIFEFGASASPALRELCVLAMASFEDQETLRNALGIDLLNLNPGRRSWSAFALGRHSPGTHLPDLLQRAVLDRSEEVRGCAQVALRAADEPGLVSPIVRALSGSSSSKVRVHAAEALGNMGYMAAVPGLIARLATLEGAAGSPVPHSNIFVGRQMAYLQDFDVEVSQGQAVADPQLNVLVEGQVTDVGVVSVQQVSSERRAVQGALVALAGEKAGRTSLSWARWWDERRADATTGSSRDR